MTRRRATGEKKTLEEFVILEKTNGVSDADIGKKYRVTAKYIEKLIMKKKGVNISSLKEKKKIKTLFPKDFKAETTTVWSFRQRGDWATHNGKYRGNWSPYVPRNVILKYSKPGDLVLDYFSGGGTTAIECKLLGRRCIALDINEQAIELARDNLYFEMKEFQQSFFGENLFPFNVYEPELRVGDARDLSFLENNSVDLICSHPPYSNIIYYTNKKNGDLSFLSMEDYLQEMEKVASESFRVLKSGGKCAILIGDMRRKKRVFPLAFLVMDKYLKAGFELKELVIKRQYNCKTTGFWFNKSIKYNFLLLAHEYLPIFEKPVSEEKKIEPFNFQINVTKEIDLKRIISLESTSVWLFPSCDLDSLLVRNITERYAGNENYVLINGEREISKGGTDAGKKLLFIMNFIHNEHDLASYLNQLKDFVTRQMTRIIKGGHVAIQTQDIRMGNYVIPMAKKIVESLKINNLLLKEIIIVTADNLNSPENEKSFYQNHYEIVHRYVLVFEVV